MKHHYHIECDAIRYMRFYKNQNISVHVEIHHPSVFKLSIEKFSRSNCDFMKDFGKFATKSEPQSCNRTFVVRISLRISP